MTVWERIAVWEVFLMVPFATAFPVLYGVFFPWYRTTQGRAIFVKSVGMALLVDFAVLYRLTPGVLPNRHIVAAVVYGVILLGQVGLLTALLLSWGNRKGTQE